MKKSNSNTKRIIITSIIIIVISLGLISVFAWFLKEDTIKNVGISNFQTTADVYFEVNNKRTEVNDYLVGGLVKVNLFDKDAKNFIGNLRLDVKQKGFSPCYLRVRILEQWIDDKTDDIMQGANIPYIWDNEWYDHRVADLCIYYKNMISTYDDATPMEKTIPVIKGVNNDYLGADTGVSMYLQFKVETVQPNRMKAFWGVDETIWGGQ